MDQAILSEEERVVVVRFGHDWDPTCMQMDEILYKIADKVRSSGCWVHCVRSRARDMPGADLEFGNGDSLTHIATNHTHFD